MYEEYKTFRYDSGSQNGSRVWQAMRFRFSARCINIASSPLLQACFQSSLVLAIDHSRVLPRDHPFDPEVEPDLISSDTGENRSPAPAATNSRYNIHDLRRRMWAKSNESPSNYIEIRGCIINRHSYITANSGILRNVRTAGRFVAGVSCG